MENSMGSSSHFIDIHQIPEHEEGIAYTSSMRRQVSLETGFSALKGRKPENKTLKRSGTSFGGFASAQTNRDFRIFRTKSSLIQHRPNDNFSQHAHHDSSSSSGVTAGRYFAALTGPELDQVKDSESILLPEHETWPFLLRFPIGCFGICLGLSSQAILWKTLSNSQPIINFIHIPPFINLIIWLLALTILLLIFITYALKCIFYIEAVKREYYHPVRVNFFFAPWVVCMFLAIGVPEHITIFTSSNPQPWIFCVFMAPILLLDVKIYGQWLSGGRRRLCKVANPSSHLSVVGNFVGAILAARVGWEETGKFLWAIGFAHYLVVFVTLYQRLPTSEALPKELHPVYSMFIATPAAASIAWAGIHGGEFDNLARICYFIALFLYCSLIVRVNFFWGFKFSLAWWSYTFPMTTASIATIKYAEAVPSIESKVMAMALSLMSSTMVSILFVTTLLHAFVWKTLFPNDLAIAITKTKENKERKQQVKRGYNIKRWTKQSPLSFVSSNKRKQQDTEQDHKQDNSKI